MKSLIFDSSTVISLAMNNMLWILEPLKARYKGDFYITEEVKKEIIDTPMGIKRFKLEAIQIQSFIDRGIIKVYESKELQKEIKELDLLSNSIFIAKEKNMHLIDIGELSAMVLAKKIQADALIIDERTTRMLIEAPEALQSLLKKKFHMEIKMNREKLKTFQQKINPLSAIRSIELSIAAYELGLLDKKYLPKNANKEKEKDILDAVIWGMRLKGCSISDREIEELLKEETKKTIPKQV
ncbi:hypothetical protein HZA98_00465 [Candidatus Woesearchaeota archaeon]|nr:hypothetical protein [Candidatus Woesearchaeota archaeon]